MSMTSTPQTAIQPPQRSLSEHPSTTMVFTSSSNTVCTKTYQFQTEYFVCLLKDERDSFASDDRASLSPSISCELQQKQVIFAQKENQSMSKQAFI